MPHKFYHGKTGRVFNITKHAIGVIVNKRVGNRINVRTEHVRMSNSREAFKNRVRENDKKKREAKAAGTRVDIKRKAVQQRESQLIKTSDTEIEFMNPIKIRELY